MLDLPAGAKVAGSGFPLYTGMGARLQRALVNFFLDLHTREHGYTEVEPPFLVTRESMQGTGQYPKFVEEGDAYGLPEDGLFLVPTSEVPLVNMLAGRDAGGGGAPRGLRRTRPAFAARRARRARTRADCCGCTSSARWSWCASSGRKTRGMRWSG